MGIEGNARNQYYQFFDRLVQDEGFKMERTRADNPHERADQLPGSSMCYILALSAGTHLDPRIGFLHETNFRQFSLNLDVRRW